MSLSPTQAHDFATGIVAHSFLPNIAEWTEQQRRYSYWWDLYSGERLKENIPGTEDPATPLRINPFRVYANMHGMLTLGSMPGEQIIRIYAEPLLVNPEEEGPIEDRTTGRIIESVWKENGWLDLLPEAARIMQALGGVFVKVVHDSEFFNGVRIEVLPPNVVYPVFGPQRRLIEVWITYHVSAAEAAAYGLNTDGDNALYVEHWTESEWNVKVGRNGEELQVAILDGERLEGVNPYKLPNERRATIPFFYAARLRTIANYGTSIAEDMAGLVREINERSADMGDSIGRSGHRERFASNWRGARDADGRIILHQGPDEIVDMGVTPAGSEPTKIEVHDPPAFSPAYPDFLSALNAYLSDSSLTAPVIMGRDEGSQRSGETLAARALPTVTAVSYYRTALAELLHNCSVQTLRIMALMPAVKGAGTRNGIKPEQVRAYRFHTDWWPVLPKDRREVAEIEAMLFGAGIRSLEMAIHSLGDVRNIEEEVTRIKAMAEEKAKLEAQSNPQPPFRQKAGTQEKPNVGKPTTIPNS